MDSLRVTVLLTTALVVAITGAACGDLPPWAGWVANQPDYIKKYVTRNSEVVDWLHSSNGPTWPLSNWVKAVKYIVYVAPERKEDPTPLKVVQVAESPNTLDCSTKDVPYWGEVTWGKVSERDFANAVQAMNGGTLESQLFKAAVRIAYWMASKIPTRDYSTPGDMDWTEFTPLQVLKEYWRGWNCAGHAVLAVALMRAAMIPAKVVGGLLAGEGHAWVAFYNQDFRWVHVDPTGDAGNSYMQLYLAPRVIIDDDVEAHSGYYCDDNATTIDDIEREWIPVAPIVVVAALMIVLMLAARRGGISA
ncbi:transglutaminase-like domain-containing protein [Methanopyrus kandleri]